MRTRSTAAALLALLTPLVVSIASHNDVAHADTQMSAPSRVLDTRNGLGARRGSVAAGEVLTLTIPGISITPSTAVMLNLTVVDAGVPGNVSAWPCAGQRPSTSIVNFEPGRAVPNMVALAYTSAGVCFSSTSPVNLIADLTAITTNGEITGVAPQRLLDTRASSPLAPGVERRISVAGSPGIPGSAVAAAVNVTIVDPQGPGYAIVKPCGSATDASTVNFLTNEVVAHFTFSALSGGALCVVSSVATNVIVDSFAWMGSSSTLKTLTPARLLDTRIGLGGTSGAMRSGQTARLAVANRGGIPTNAAGATVNIAAVGGENLGFITVWPCDADHPTASTINMWPGIFRSNQATIKLSGSGELCIRPFIVDGSSIHVVVDGVGYVTTVNGPTPPPPTPPTPPPPSGKFTTLPVGATLPTGAQCAARVRPTPEIRPENAAANANRGSRAVANTRNDWVGFSRVDGDFAGTTDEIIQWAACKWGIDEDFARAQLVKESYWRMSAVGDGGESFGVGQVRTTAHGSAFQYASVNARNSTAYNLDYTYAVWRGCFEGVYTWLNSDLVEHNGTYAAGDAWGCLGVWFSGRWYVNNQAYLEQPGDSVRHHLNNRTWATPGF